LDKLGFRDVSGIEQDRKETNDEFINRQSGYVKFYAALIEVRVNFKCFQKVCFIA